MGTGRYIVFEGAEGCGKSTHAANLANELNAVLTRETGGTNIGRAIRTVLHDPANTELADRAEALLTAADRAQHMAELVRPALRSGQPRDQRSQCLQHVGLSGIWPRVCRSTSSAQINDWAIEGLWPELIILLDVPVEVLAERMTGRDLDRFEQADAEFHARVRDGFATMAAADPERWVVIDGSGSTCRRLPRSSALAVARSIGHVMSQYLGRGHRSAKCDAPVGGVGRVTGARLSFRRAAGSTKHEAARAFAALLLSGSDDPDQRDARLALAGAHPDVREFARVGAAINKEQADEIVRSGCVGAK